MGRVVLGFAPQALTEILDLSEVGTIVAGEIKDDGVYLVLQTSESKPDFTETWGVKAEHVVGASYEQDEFGAVRLVGLEDTEVDSSLVDWSEASEEV
jgi:hypothetical protein